MKKTIHWLLSILLSLGMAGAVFLRTVPAAEFSPQRVGSLKAEQNITGQQVLSLSLDKEAAVPGDTVTATLKTAKGFLPDTEPSESYLYLENNGILSPPFLFEGKDGIYTAKIRIPETSLNGTWSLSSLVLTDPNGNTYRAEKDDFPKVVLEVSNGSEDRSAPEVTALYTMQETVSAGDTVIITCEYSDESALSLKLLDSYVYFENGSFRSGLCSFEQSGEGVLTAAVTIDETFADGTYEFAGLHLTDAVGNSFLANADPQFSFAPSFIVSGNPATSVYSRPGWYTAGGKRYYNDSYGNPVTGWLLLKEGWYFFDASGAMQTGWITDGAKYFLDSDGIMVTGWILLGEDWYFFNASGAMQTGIVRDADKTYYMNEDGVMQTGWLMIEKERYFFNNDGEMQNGWLFEQGSWYYLDTGRMRTGWIQVGNLWYYLKDDGRMASSEWCGGYWLSADGGWRYSPVGSWKQNSKGWWFEDTSGWYAKNETVRINHVLYRFNEEGYWVP